MEKWLRNHPEDVNLEIDLQDKKRYKDMYFVVHHEDCPLGQAAIAKGKELGEKYGW